MNKEEAVEKLLRYLDSISVGWMDRKITTYRYRVALNIEKQIKENKLMTPKDADFNGFVIGKGEPGVFIFYREYVGYYCYDYAFYFIIPRTPQKKPYVEIWNGEEVDSIGLFEIDKKSYDWAYPTKTYDITSLVMKTSQMPYMNWKRPPL